MRRFSFSSIKFLIIVFIGYYVSHMYLFTLDTMEARRDQRKWQVPTLAIKSFSGEFRGLMADFLLMESSALFGTELRKVRGGGYIAINEKPDLTTILRLLQHSIALDPYFQQTYLSTQGWLPWYGNNYIDETNKILMIADDARWWDWQPLRFIGFNTYYFLNDMGGAGKIFLEASKREAAPPFLAVLGARLSYKGGETGAAVALMKSMLVDKDETDYGYQDMVDRLGALEGVLILENAIEKYRNEFGREPDVLNDLVSATVLSALPANPYNIAYCLDFNGQIHFDNPECRDSD